MLHWFQSKLISDESAEWINDCGNWFIDQFDGDAFRQNTPLVTPDAHYFPAKVDSPKAMAEYVLQRVAEIAGVSNLPWRLTDVSQCQLTPPKLLPFTSLSRHQNTALTTFHADDYLEVPFIAEQLKKPQDLVASTAHSCAQHLLWQSQQTPPGGMDYFQQAAEVLAVFMGFGIVMANSAYSFRGSCAKCFDARANRQAALSESEAVYALALFSKLKAIPAQSVTKHLKPYLRNSFKIALKQVNQSYTARAESPKN